MQSQNITKIYYKHAIIVLFYCTLYLYNISTQTMSENATYFKARMSQNFNIYEIGFITMSI